MSRTCTNNPSHNFVYVDNSDIDFGENTLEFYVCIECGEESQLEYNPERAWIL